MDIFVEFSPTENTQLCEIMARHGSDKGAPYSKGHHNYTAYYYNLFNNIKNNKLRIFELGLGTNYTDVPSNMGINGKPGASLRGWKEFFPNSDIFGADIDRRVLFNEDGIKTYYCDQTNKNAIANLWSNPDLSENFDIIIDDGLHEINANKIFFENSHHKLNIGGVYIIEDCHTQMQKNFTSLINQWKLQYPNFTFWINTLQHKNTFDNDLIVIKREY